ncbi:Guanosine-diphosphatase [Glutinoglossum americanum]|uniref:guanosine-diphosphatase n=1 Tax=Glutinoglossum americanum TaxID=1670608 RepID=A0A9P8L639_9PEZI|nr:Guanosine-diphosphatase [Glutinoglossum americanum]
MSRANVRRRPSIWSYFSFSSTPERQQSVSLPTRSAVDDPYEKPNRHSSRNPVNDSANFVPGLKNAWMTQSQRSRFIKAGGLIAFILLVFLYLSPGKNFGNIVGDHGNHQEGTGGLIPLDPSSGGTKCQKSAHSTKPIIQYAIVIDAGSTGSRIHIYRFNNCGDTPELENEEFKMTAKRPEGSGLSSYGDNPEEAAESLDPLLEVAMNSVPENLKSCTPIVVKATAGLRLLGPEKSGLILAAVRHRLETKYPFSLVSAEKGGVEIMDGKDEGVYAWVTTNYLLGKIGGPDKTPTAAVFDLGGGSTQIVFEPTFKSSSGGMPEKLAEGDHKYELDFGGRKFTLYQHSHLGYGLMAARKAVHKAVVQSHYDTKNSSDTSWLSKSVPNPCLAPGQSRTVEVKLDADHPLGEAVNVKMVGPAEGSLTSAALCRSIAEKILRKEKHCELHPCSFNGVHQPSLDKTFSREDVFIFSYFYDRTQPLGMPESFTIKELKDLTEKVCDGERSWDTFSSVEGALEELKGRPEWCLDLNFMMALLHTGYEMPIDREVKIAKKIKGNELGWCLGAR